MTTTHINRKPKGTRTGGQFAPSQNPEATLDLDPVVEPRPKVDFAQRQQELIEQLSDGVAALTSSDEWRRHLDFQSRFHNYSFGNTILIAIQRPDASREDPPPRPVDRTSGPVDHPPLRGSGLVLFDYPEKRRAISGGRVRTCWAPRRRGARG